MDWLLNIVIKMKIDWLDFYMGMLVMGFFSISLLIIILLSNL